MKNIFLTFMTALLFGGCAGPRIKKTDWTNNTGTLKYFNFSGIEDDEFQKKIRPYIACKQSHQDISETPYSPVQGEGEFKYMCVSYARHCDHGHGKSCMILGLESLNKDPVKAQKYFIRSCQGHFAKGCYMAGLYSRSNNAKEEYYRSSCTMGHIRACRDIQNLAKTVNISADLAFIDDYLQHENAKTTKLGVAYKILSPGKGPQALANSTVTVHYTGRLINGEVFDATDKISGPAEFSLDQVILGWKEAIPLLKEGGKMQIVVPAALAYGSQGVPGKIPAGATLVFDVELVEVH